ncbi:urea ABC transporter permease subunit UrtB [Parahaliea maris]|uniref:Urea ABC transporter permease subunit UrtB n=1 Tax=Parahaliea maris TaxID=2716870 RepID=A0A5C9A543_9GAMM|nr:urea ABC transporter permease subunit UrtB [Parahaliea maris]
MCCLGSTANAESGQTAATESLLARLPSANLRETATLVGELEQSGGDRMLPLFQIMLDGRLYSRKSDDALVAVTQPPTGDWVLTDVFTGASLGTATRREVSKVRVNNRLRVQLREAIARIQLNAEDAGARLAAVDTLFGDLNDSSAALLSERRDLETDDKVKGAIEEALALYRLRSSSEPAVQVAALNVLAESLNTEVRYAVEQLAAADSAAALPVRNAARKALTRIDSNLEFYGFLEQLFFGLSLGSVLLLAAIGLAITFGVMGVINMAHGEMIMLGAYTTYVIQLLMPDHIGLSLWIAIPAAFLVSGLVGVIIERGVIRFLKGRPLETLLATFGISLILQQAVRTIFSPLNRQVASPEWMSGSLEINAALSITYNRLYILLFALLVFALLQLILKKTSLGLNVRAVSQNRDMAKAMGIRTEWVDAMTFGLGSGVAGVAGVALSQLTNVGPNLGQSYIIDSFMVVVFGGVGNLLGTLVGGFTLGVANKFLEPMTGAVLANILILVFIILFIQKRPKGLFPQKGRAAND